MVRTPWGYSIDVEDVPPLVTPGEFEAITGGAFLATDERVAPALAGVSAAVRSACHWHVAPSLPCVAEASGPGRLISLPTLEMSAVASVTESGTALTDGEDFEWRADGLLRRCCFRQWPSAWRSVSVEFTSGFDVETVPDLAQVVAQIVSNAIAASPGVLREQAGDVSVTFNTMQDGVSGGVTLLQRDLLMLRPYTLPVSLG